MRKPILLLCSLIIVLTVDAQIKAMVGGTLIDGYGGEPILNSVIIIDGEKIKSVGKIGELPIPAGAEIISTEGMTVMPGSRRHPVLFRIPAFAGLAVLALLITGVITRRPAPGRRLCTIGLPLRSGSTP